MPSARRPTGRSADVPARLFVDSGAWIALRNRRDQHHAAADRLFHEAIDRRVALITTNLVVAETQRLTLFGAGPLAALRAIDRIDASDRVTVVFPDRDDHAAARRWLERLSPRPVTYTDAVSFAVMDRIACTHVLGFDSDFGAAGFVLWNGFGSDA